MKKRKKSILFVENEPYVDCFIECFSFKRKDYLILWYRQFNEAIDAIRNGLKYDIAFVDASEEESKVMHLQTLGRYSYILGSDVVDASKEINKKIPVISISAYPTMRNGCDSHIRKPFDLSDLEREIDHYLSFNSKK